MIEGGDFGTAWVRGEIPWEFDWLNEAGERIARMILGAGANYTKPELPEQIGCFAVAAAAAPWGLVVMSARDLGWDISKICRGTGNTHWLDWLCAGFNTVGLIPAIAYAGWPALKVVQLAATGAAGLRKAFSFVLNLATRLKLKPSAIFGCLTDWVLKKIPTVGLKMFEGICWAVERIAGWSMEGVILRARHMFAEAAIRAEKILAYFMGLAKKSVEKATESWCHRTIGEAADSPVAQQIVSSNLSAEWPEGLEEPGPDDAFPSESPSQQIASSDDTAAQLLLLEHQPGLQPTLPAGSPAQQPPPNFWEQPQFYVSGNVAPEFLFA